MKSTIVSLLIFLAIFSGGVYYTHTPEFMLTSLADVASTNGDVSGYLTGDMKKAMKNVKKTESVVNLFTGSISNEKFMNFIVQNLALVDWELVSIQQDGNKCYVDLNFHYDSIFDVDGTVTVKLEKKVPEDLIKKIITNPWKISSIEDINI